MAFADIYQKQTLGNILEHGTMDRNPRPKYSDGTPAYTKYIPHVLQQYDLSKGQFPIGTLRPQAWKSAIKEIFWIYQMQSNKLEDLHKLNITYWDKWDIGDGTIGCRYGRTVYRHNLMDNLLTGLKCDPFGRRHILCMWQEDDFHDSTGGTDKGLNPCCYETIWNVREVDGDIYLDMLMNQRSSDYIVSSLINEIQYVALQLMVAKHCGYKPGLFSHMMENVQIYDRHIDKAIEYINREPFDCNPILILNKNKTDFYSFTIDDFKIINLPTDEIKVKNPQMTFDLGI